MEPAIYDGAGFVVLDRDQCFELLADGGIGRVAVNAGALPLILPVHFSLHGEHVVFRVGADTTLDRATRDAVVAFEADGQEGGGHWSVTLTGVARHECGDAPGPVVRVSTEHMSGRRSQ